MNRSLSIVLLCSAALPALAADPCAPGSLAYTVSSGSSLLLAKPDGAMDLVVWAEPQNWNAGSKSAMGVASTQSSISLGQTFRSVKVYDPTRGTAAIAEATNTDKITLGLTDHPLVVEVSGPSGATPSGATKATSTLEFLNSIGVDHHIGWSGTPYADLAKTKADLAYLGVSNVRDQAPSAGNIAAYRELANSGVRFDLLTTPAGQDVASTLGTDMANIEALAQSNPGSVATVEAPNELNGQTVTLHGASSADPSVGAAIARAVSAAVRASGLLQGHGVKVANVTVTNGMANWKNYTIGLGNLSGAVDFANWHVYFNGGDQPARNVASMMKDAWQAAPGKPVIFTEAGYFTATQDGSGWGGVDEATQAKNTLNLLADAYKAGVQQTYLYELMEGVANPSSTDIENTFGLFRADGTPKPVATAIHNLTAILNPGGGAPWGNACWSAVMAAAGLTPNASTPLKSGGVAGPSYDPGLVAPAEIPTATAAPEPVTTCGPLIMAAGYAIRRDCKDWAVRVPPTYEDAEGLAAQLLAKEPAGIQAAKARLGKH